MIIKETTLSEDELVALLIIGAYYQEESEMPDSDYLSLADLILKGADNDTQ